MVIADPAAYQGNLPLLAAPKWFSIWLIAASAFFRKKITADDNRETCRSIRKENPGGKGDSFMTPVPVLFTVTHFVSSVSYWWSQGLELFVIYTNPMRGMAVSKGAENRSVD